MNRECPMTQSHFSINLYPSSLNLKMIPSFFILCISYACFFGAKFSAEIIVHLPGQPANVSFKQYSGYIFTDAEQSRALFYYFVEAEPENPLPRPLTVWFSGGPGCSSLGYGAFMEHGPFKPGNEGLLVRNKYSWNSVSNMLYVESPIGVGFSYSTKSSDYSDWNDATTASDNLQFVINWLKIFPEYKDSDLFFAGDSYAGHYIPQLVKLLLDYNRQPKNQPIKLRAIALGNPLLDIDISIDASEFLWSHGVISDEMLAIKRRDCNNTRFLLEYIHKNSSKECLDTYAKLELEMGSDTDPDDLLLPKCVSPAPNQSVFMGNLAHPKLRIRGDMKMEARDPCLPDRINAYLRNPGVQKALHVKTSQLQAECNFCSSVLEYQLDNIATDIIPLLAEILGQNIPILLYSGDQDAKIPLTQTRKIAYLLAKQLNLTSLGGYGRWYDGLQVGGWSQSFGRLTRNRNVTDLTFATVVDGGHEVPFTSPSQALTLFKAFLRELPPPKFGN